MNYIKRILITGSEGFIGSHLLTELKKNKQNIITTWDRTKKPHQEIETMVEFKELKPFNIIIHCAATCDGGYDDDPMEVCDNNVMITNRLLDWARKGNLKDSGKFIFMSSAGVEYPNSNPYSFSKYINEQFCKFYSERYKIRIRNMRLYNVYGPNNFKGVIYNWLRLIIEDKKITMKAPLEYTRDYIYVDDVVSAIVAVVNNESYDRYINYWIGSGKSTSLGELFKIIEEVTQLRSNYPVIMNANLNQPTFPKCSNPSFSCNVPLKEGVEKTYEFLQKYLKNTTKNR